MIQKLVTNIKTDGERIKKKKSCNNINPIAQPDLLSRIAFLQSPKILRGAITWGRKEQMLVNIK